MKKNWDMVLFLICGFGLIAVSVKEKLKMRRKEYKKPNTKRWPIGGDCKRGGLK